MTISTTDANAINSISEGDIIASGHFLSCENGRDPIVDITEISLTPYKEYSNTFSQYNVEEISTVYDTANNKSVIFYRDETTQKSYGVVVSVNSIEEITIGESAVFHHNFVQRINAVYDKNSGKIVIVYNDVENDLLGYLITCKIVGNTIVYDSPIIFESGPSNNLSLCYNEYEKKFIITYSTIELQPKHRVMVGSIESDGIFIGSDTEYKIGNIQYVNSTYDSKNHKNIISYYDTENGRGSSIICTIDGYNATFTKESIFNSKEISHVTSVYNSFTDNIILLYQDTSNRLYGMASFGRVVNGELIFSSPVVFNDAETSSIKSVYDENVKSVIISYHSVYGDTIQNNIIVVPTFIGNIIYRNEYIYNTDPITYLANDAVIYKGNIYIAKRTNKGDTIDGPTDETNWTLYRGYSVYSTSSTSSTSIIHLPNINKVLVAYNNDYNKKGIIGIFSPYQFIYNIYDSGFGWKYDENVSHNKDITLEIIGGSGSGASATGIISVDGSLEYVVFKHGSGYTTDINNVPKIGDITGYEVHEVYLGEGTDDNPIIELEGYNSVVGKIIGQEDVDTIESGGKITKNIYIEHYSGDMSRAKVDDIFGELYNPRLLGVIAPNCSLPSINYIKELETPISAMNNLHNYSNIDYTFDSKLFIGNDIYSLMKRELIPNWPEFTYSIEKSMDAIITRNIKDVYKSIGTEDAIKFAFASIYGREASVLIPSEKMYYLNSGVWDTIHTIDVNVEQDKSIFDMTGRLIYNMSDIIIKNKVHDMDTTLTIETESNHNLRSGYYITILGDTLYNGKYKVDVLNDKVFNVNILYSVVSNKQPGRYLEIAKQHALVETVTPKEYILLPSGIQSDILKTATIQVSNISGTFTFGDSISGVLNNGIQFSYTTTTLASNEGYVSNKCLLNGSLQQPVPSSYNSYGDWGTVNTIPAALKLSDHINTDRMQDGEYYQLFSYVVKIKKENPPLLDLYTKDEITNTIIKLVHPGGFRLIIEEE